MGNGPVGTGGDGGTDELLFLVHPQRLLWAPVCS